MSYKRRVRGIAERQAGRISSGQLGWMQVPHGTISGWRRTGDLIAVLPRVYAVGHHAPSEEGDLWAAILYAGPEAMLSHVTAAWWRGLIDARDDVIQVTTPRQVGSLPGIVVYGRHAYPRELVRGVPVAPLGETVLGLAATAEIALVRKALARLDFRHEFDRAALLDMCQRGRPGSRALRWAIEHYDPRFGRTLSWLEDFWLWFCERRRVPKPDHVNVRVHGVLVDTFYVLEGVVIELDGFDGHHSPAQLRQNHANDMLLRSHGLIVRRYSKDLVVGDWRAVRREVMATLKARRAEAGRGPERRGRAMRVA